MFTNIRRKRFCESVKLERERESVREGERERERERACKHPPYLSTCGNRKIIRRKVSKRERE